MLKKPWCLLTCPEGPWGLAVHLAATLVHAQPSLYTIPIGIHLVALAQYIAQLRELPTKSQVQQDKAQLEQACATKGMVLTATTQCSEPPPGRYLSIFMTCTCRSSELCPQLGCISG